MQAVIAMVFLAVPQWPFQFKMIIWQENIFATNFCKWERLYISATQLSFPSLNAWYFSFIIRIPLMELCEIFKMISVYIGLAATITLYFLLYIFCMSNQSNQNQLLLIQTDCIHKTSNLVNLSGRRLT